MRSSQIGAEMTQIAAIHSYRKLTIATINESAKSRFVGRIEMKVGPPEIDSTAVETKQRGAHTRTRLFGWEEQPPDTRHLEGSIFAQPP